MILNTFIPRFASDPVILTTTEYSVSPGGSGKTEGFADGGWG
jgi:hypothetical protein